MELTRRACLECGKVVKGRADKKFCDDFCRNAYNNRQNSEQNSFVRNINNALRKNRRILQAQILDGEKMGRVSRQSLLANGFVFKYFTHQYFTSNEKTYVFCYEYGYLPLEGDMYLVVKRKKE